MTLIAAVAGTAIASSGPDANTSVSAKNTAQKALAKAKKALAKAKQDSRTVHLAWITPGGGQNINPSCTISGNDTTCSFAGSSPSANNALLAIRFSGIGTPAAADAAVGYCLVPE